MGIDRIVSSRGHVSRIILVAVFGLTTLVSAPAFEVTDQQRQACMPDAFRLCSSEMPDANRIAACMAAKKASLSAPCRAVFAAFSSERSAAPLRRSHKVHGVYARHHKWHSLSRYAHYREPYGLRHHTWSRS